eukprot:GHVS01038826.1.p1 GENE.GHVS01038826.1~~GHVS01038826.1.p1  ORF type:complete len:797 (+),score=187.41 GHVS01038826.1:170-2560(+)
MASSFKDEKSCQDEDERREMCQLERMKQQLSALARHEESLYSDQPLPLVEGQQSYHQTYRYEKESQKPPLSRFESGDDFLVDLIQKKQIDVVKRPPPLCSPPQKSEEMMRRPDGREQKYEEEGDWVSWRDGNSRLSSPNGGNRELEVEEEEGRWAEEERREGRRRGGGEGRRSPYQEEEESSSQSGSPVSRHGGHSRREWGSAHDGHLGREEEEEEDGDESGRVGVCRGAMEEEEEERIRKRRIQSADMQRQTQKLSGEFRELLRSEVSARDSSWMKKLQKLRLEFDRERDSITAERRKAREEARMFKVRLQKEEEAKEKLASQLDQMQNDEIRSSTKFDAIRRDQIDAENQRVEAERHARNLEKGSEDLDRQLQHTKQTNKQLQLELDHATAQLQALTNKKRTTDSRLETLQESNEAQEQALQDLQAGHRELQQKHDVTVRASQQALSDYDAASRELKKLQAKLQETEVLMDDRKQNEKHAYKTVEDSKTRERGLRDDIKLYQQKVAETEVLHRDLKNAKAEVETLRIDSDRFKNEISSIRSENKHLESLVGKLKLEQQSTSNDLYSTKQELHNLRKSHTAATTTQQQYHCSSTASLPLAGALYSPSTFARHSAHPSSPPPVTRLPSPVNVSAEYSPDEIMYKHSACTSPLRSPPPPPSLSPLPSPAHHRSSVAAGGGFTGASAVPQNYRGRASAPPTGTLRGEGTGVGVTIGQGLGVKQAELQMEHKNAMEKQLLLLNMEQNEIESSLARLPASTQGRTMKERQNRVEAETRLAEVERSVHSIKQKLRQSHRPL